MYILKKYDEALCKFDMKTIGMNLEVNHIEILNDMWKFALEMNQDIANETLKR